MEGERNVDEVLDEEEIETILSGEKISETDSTTEIQSNKDYEPIIQDVGSALVNTQLFVGFLVCGVIVAIKIFGEKL